VASVPEFDILRVANLSRNSNNPFSLGNKVLLNLTLKEEADLTQI
jgi:hypothetical protein